MNNCSVNNLLDLSKTIAKELFDDVIFPWEVLPNIKEFIIKLGAVLDQNKFDNPQENVWIAKTANRYDTAYLSGPCIIDEGAEVGNSTELKNCLLFDNVQVPHYNYVGDSVLGYKAHLGAGAITSNVKSDKTLVTVKQSETNTVLQTELRKFGAVIGDNTEVGCNTVLCPGTIIGRECIIYPQSRVRGVVNARSIYKDPEHIIKRQ